MTDRDKMFKRVLDNKCPISNTIIAEKDETELVDYNGAKLKVKKKYVRFQRSK